LNLVRASPSCAGARRSARGRRSRRRDAGDQARPRRAGTRAPRHQSREEAEPDELLRRDRQEQVVDRSAPRPLPRRTSPRRTASRPRTLVARGDEHDGREERDEVEQDLLGGIPAVGAPSSSCAKSSTCARLTASAPARSGTSTCPTLTPRLRSLLTNVGTCRSLRACRSRGRPREPVCLNAKCRSDVTDAALYAGDLADRRHLARPVGEARLLDDQVESRRRSARGSRATAAPCPP